MDIVTSSLQEILVDFLTFLPDFVAGLAIFVMSLYSAGLLSRIIQAALTRRQVETEIVLVVMKISRWTIILLGTFAALQQVGFNVSAFLAGLGILGFTIGFALQDISKNLIAGLLLLLEQPFNIGDIIEINDFLGRVLQIDLRTTEILTLDGQNVMIPNGDVFSSPIKNYSRNPKRRLDLTVGVAYGSDLELVRKTTVAAVEGVEGILREPAPKVVFRNFGESSIDFVLYFWIDFSDSSVLRPLNVYDAVITNINQAFIEQGIEIPFPIRTVMMER
jgi:small conductance mechanosensitive channel